MPEVLQYDVVIIGGGPAGLSAAIYTARARLNTLLIERGMVGGQIVNAELVENYPGYAGISGMELTQKMHEQATGFGLKTVTGEVTGISTEGERKTVNTGNGSFAAHAIIIASGSERSKLGVPGEEKYTGKGVSYCATCDAAFFRDKPVAVVGGGNSALTEALHLTHYASKVTLIHRRNQLRATAIMQERIRSNPKMALRLDTVVDAIEGNEFVSELKLRDVNTKKNCTLEVAGVFVSVGFRPNTSFLKSIVPLDQAGAVIVDENLQTKIPGIYAAGDVRSRSVWQVITAAGDGACAGIHVERALGGYG
ncbi:MAG: thioredoxin-disulfide reductase [Dehalococcoidales bacterium]|nr:thioredoxin-disulfide reductase [Dehalococcoidales bacterium]